MNKTSGGMMLNNRTKPGGLLATRFGLGSGVPKTLLFVDDDPALLEARRLVFEAMGYGVVTAGSGEEALELLQANPVDAVILDYLLPGMNGGEVALRIRRAYANIVIVFCSGGFAVPQPVVEVVNASLSKGKGPVALLEILEEQLQIVPASGTALEAAPVVVSG